MVAYHSNDYPYILRRLVLQTRKKVHKAHRKGFDSLVALVVWQLWLQHNVRVFGGHQVAPAMLTEFTFQECEIWCHARLIDRSSLSDS
jgi:hypothetical protein